MEQISTPMVYYRGGTSKAVFIDQRDLPVQDEKDLTAWILAIYGSPDRRQIDGLGGADFLTSKFAVVGPPTRPDADVDYTFYQVSVTQSNVSKDLNCGNISSAVGPYAIEQGFVKADGDTTIVRVHATNFDDMIYLTVKTENGKPKVLGTQYISGVPGTGSPITVDFRDTVGTHGKGLLPTGNLRDKIQVEGVGEFEVSIVDLANVLVFVKAEDFGLKGNEDPDEMTKNKNLIDTCEKLRYAVGVKIGLAKDLDEAVTKCALTPFLAIVSKPQDWTDYGTNQQHKADECDFTARVVLGEEVHKAYMASGSGCTGVATLLPGTVLNEIARKSGLEGTVKIAHPSGTLEVDAALEKQGDKYKIKRASLIRTARRLADGKVFAAINRLPWEQGSDRKQDSHSGPGGAENMKQVSREIFHAM